MTDRYTLGIDIGGTKVAGAIIDKTGSFMYRNELPSNTTTSETMFKTVIDCIHKVLKESKMSITDFYGISIGIPGKVDIKNGIAVFQNNIPWGDFPIVDRLKIEFGESLKISIDNDVKMAAYAEYKAKEIPKNKIFTYVTVSTGLAATNIINNQILRGNGFSGEIGFIPIKINSEYISLEDYASGPAIHKAAYGMDSTKEVFNQAYKGNTQALEIIKKRAHALATGLYSIICILDPSSIVLGGSVAYHNPEFIEMIIRELSNLVHNEQKHILKSVFSSKLASNNGIIGAGLSVLDY